MSLLVVGSIALDTIQMPFGKARNALGGSAVYFSLSASFFTKVRIVGVVGEDFPKDHIRLLKSKGVDTEGLKVTKGETFRWSGQYKYSLNEAETLSTKLNVFRDFRPRLPANYRYSDHIFLANIDPELQLEVLKQMKSPELVACDTMNYWIESKKPALKKVLKHVDIFILNEAEARQLSGEPNLFKSAKVICGMGPKTVIIKKGEHGSLMRSGGAIFIAPAYPIETIYDPTGAGDSFAGGFMGFLSQKGRCDKRALRLAIIYGTIIASFNVEKFGTKRLEGLDIRQIRARLNEFSTCVRF